MPFFILGISHATAPVAIRERLSFSAEQIPEVLRALTGLAGIQEAVILSTCNRTEIYAHLENASGTQLTDWITRMRTPDDPGVRERFYTHDGEAAAQHLFRVACGLDSMILGEPQILGQIKAAYELAQHNGAAGNHLHRLFQYAFAVAKQVRTNTRIGENPVSVAYATVRLARQIFADFSKLTALLIGAGETIELVARHLREQGTRRMIIANRTLSRAHQLAEQFGGYAIGLHEIPAHLGEADIVIASTGGREPILTRAATCWQHLTCAQAPPAAHGGYRRAAGHDASGGGHGRRLSIHHRRPAQGSGRQSALPPGGRAAKPERSSRPRWRSSWSASVVSKRCQAIRAVREHAAELRDHTLEQAQRLLAGGARRKQALKFLAETLTNRLMHAPTAYLRQAAHEGRDQIIREIHELFGLKDKDQNKNDDV